MVSARSSKAGSRACFLISLGLALASQATAQPRDFLRKVSVREVEADLRATLADLLSGSSSSQTSAGKRFAGVEASTWKTFQAMPKNGAGRLTPPAVRYVVHSYFAREHGWLIKGLEPHGMQLNATAVHDMNILQDKAPLLVENLLEARQDDRGLSFNDVVTMIAVLERMMFDESMTLLHASYYLNGLSVEEEINELALHAVLQSYLILFGQGSKANLVDSERHQALLTTRIRPEVQEFEHNAVSNFVFARRHRSNPFKARQYSFQMVTEIVEDLAQRYGKWQNSECRDMKAHLVELDPEGTGRVPLSLFYAQPQMATHHFTESADYLRRIGALDETMPRNPHVYIANYVAGPSNCIASSSYYSVCCLSECDEIVGDLERQVAAPAASPGTLLASLSNISEVALSDSLIKKLHAIASRHDGMVPLHGRLFAQWLHFVFPHECPFPSVLESANALSASQWLDGRSVASEEERNHHVKTALTSPSTAEDLDINVRWTDHEVLPVHHEVSPSPLGFGTGTIRLVVQLVALTVALRSASAAWQAATRMGDGAKKKDDDVLISLRV